MRNIITGLIASILLLNVLYTHAAPAKQSEITINERLDKIERLLQSQGLLDLLQQMEALQQEVNRLRGEIEIQNHTLAQIKKRQRDLYTDLDQRIQGAQRNKDLTTDDNEIVTEADDSGNPPLQTLAPVTSNNELPGTQQSDSPLTVEVINNQVTTAPVSVATAPANLPGTAVENETSPAGRVAESDPIQARADYQQAFKLLKQSLYDQAIKAFQEFLARHPASEYSDNAQYWLGEAYYVTRRFDQALIEYEKLVSDFPESQKLTHALLKIGYTFQELGQIDDAKSRLEQLKNDYPGTTAARLAEDRLQKMNAALLQEPATN